MRSPMPFGCLSLIIFAGVLLFPLFLANALLSALSKLGLSPGLALWVAAGIFLGGLVNIPVYRIHREQAIEYVHIRMFGLHRIIPVQPRQWGYTVIAINLGGAVIPIAVALYELLRMAGRGPNALLAGISAIAINVIVSYLIARPVPNVGIAMPSLVPGIVAAVSGFLLLPSFAAPVAFAAGVLGPLLGADLLHLRDVQKITTGMASIGGAGTFDGIVISGLIATLLA
jgi:uncharacterized membrane protein